VTRIGHGIYRASTQVAATLPRLAYHEKVKLTASIFLAALTLLAADKKTTLDKLPPPVRAAAEAQIKGATLLGVSTEKEKGKTFYELETKRNGKTRDLLLDSTGKLVSAEEEIDLDALPAPVRAALQKQSGTAKIDRVEAITKDGKLVAYEGAFKKGTKTVEAAVTPEGAPYKD